MNQQHAFPEVPVVYLGRTVMVSVKEYNILSARGHLIPVYKNAPIVRAERCLELRRENENAQTNTR